MDNKKNDNKQENVVNNKKSKLTNKLYIGYNARLAFFIIIFLIILLGAGYFLNKSIEVNGEEKINYVESSSLNYTVSLKNNDFYESKVLEKNMSYIASLVDYVNIDFNYDFKTDLNINSEFKYEIVGVLKIINPNNNDVFFTKEYTLLSEKTANIIDYDEFNIDETISIDYDYYNSLANNFKATYGVDTNSSLNVYLKITRNVDEDIVDNKMDDLSVMSITIPLSEKAISINMNYDEVNENGTILSEKNVGINDFIYLIVGTVLMVVAIVILIHTSKILMILHVKSSKYDILLKKYRREYDRLIVDVSTMPDMNELKVTKIEKFNELLDLHDNYNEPIRYYEVTPHQKSHFFIKHDDELFLYVLKSVDLEEK